MNFLQPALKLKYTSGGYLELVLPLSFRLIFLSLALLIAGEAALYRQLTIISLIFSAIFFFTGLYRERWIFGRSTENAIYQIGFVFLYRTRRYELENIRYLELRDYSRENILVSKRKQNARGRRRSSLLLRQQYANLSLITIDEDRIDLETRNTRYRATLKRNGQAVAEYIAKPFVER